MNSEHRVSPEWLAAVPALLGAAAIAPAYINHDAAWYLYMASAWLDGAVLYRDVIDTNPPLIVVLSACPAWLARVTDFTQPAVFKAWVLALAALSSAASVPAIRRAWEGRTERTLIAATLSFALFPYVGADFGQREHLAAILVAPFVFQACAWAAGRPIAGRIEAFTGVIAGLGFALKPHLLLAWLALELSVSVLRPRSGAWRRPGAIAVAVSLAVHAAAIAAFVPQYLETARDVQAVYGGLNEPISMLVRLGEVRLWLAAAAAAAILRSRSAAPRHALVLFAVASGFLLAALLQFKGWGYHLYPYRVFVLVFVAAAIGAIVQRARFFSTTLARRTIVAGLIVLVTAWSARVAVRAHRYAGTGYAGELIERLGREPERPSMALLSMRFLLFPAFPAVNYLNAEWVLRHNSLWFMPGLYRDLPGGYLGDAWFRQPAAMPPLERKFFGHIVDDLCRRPPRFLIVEPAVTQGPVRDRSFDLLAYYAQDQRFAHLFEAYEPSSTVGPFVIYARTRDTSCVGDPAGSPDAPAGADATD